MTEYNYETILQTIIHPSHQSWLSNCNSKLTDDDKQVSLNNPRDWESCSWFWNSMERRNSKSSHLNHSKILQTFQNRGKVISFQNRICKEAILETIILNLIWKHVWKIHRWSGRCNNPKVQKVLRASCRVNFEWGNSQMLGQMDQFRWKLVLCV